MARYDDITVKSQTDNGLKIGENGGCIIFPFDGNEIDKVEITLRGDNRQDHNQMLMGGNRASNASPYLGACHSSRDFYTATWSLNTFNINYSADQTFNTGKNTVVIDNLDLRFQDWTYTGLTSSDYFWGIGLYGSSLPSTGWYEFLIYEVKMYKNDALVGHYDLTEDPIVDGSNYLVPNLVNNGLSDAIFAGAIYRPGNDLNGHPTRVWVNNTVSFVPGTPIRYIKLYNNGSTSNTGNHIVECKVVDVTGTNIAAGKTVTSNRTEDTSRPFSRVVDGDTDIWTYANVGTETVIDLGAEYKNIQYVHLWRYYNGRSYYDTAIKGCNAADEEVAVFHDYQETGIYPETSDGVGKKFGVIHYMSDSETIDRLTGGGGIYENLYIGTSSGNKRVTRNYTLGDKYINIDATNNKYIRIGNNTDPGFNMNRSTSTTVTILDITFKLNNTGDHYIYSSGRIDDYHYFLIYIDYPHIKIVGRYANGGLQYEDSGLDVTAGVWTRLRVYFNTNNTTLYFRKDYGSAVGKSIGFRYETSYDTETYIGRRAYGSYTSVGNFDIKDTVIVGGKYYNNVLTQGTYNINDQSVGSTSMSDTDGVRGNYTATLVSTSVSQDGSWD